MVLNTPKQIEEFRWITMLQAVKLEQKGLKHSSGKSVSSRVKEELCIPKSAKFETVIRAIEIKLEEMK